MAKKKIIKNVNYGLPCLNCANMTVDKLTRSCNCLIDNECFWNEDQGYYKSGSRMNVCKEWKERK